MVCVESKFTKISFKIIKRNSEPLCLIQSAIGDLKKV